MYAYLLWQLHVVTKHLGEIGVAIARGQERGIFKRYLYQGEDVCGISWSLEYHAQSMMIATRLVEARHPSPEARKKESCEQFVVKFEEPMHTAIHLVVAEVHI